MARGNKFGLLAGLVWGLASQTAWATDPSPPPAAPAPSTSSTTSAAPPAAPSTQTPGGTKRADQLFDEGKQLMEQGKFVEACDKLAESDALDPAIGTLGLLATCHEQQGRTATAWREYMQTAARADAVADERGTFARERAKALETELPKLLVRLSADDPNAVVLRNGVRLQSDELGVAAPIDPGTYEIIARWPDKPEFRTSVTVTARKTSEVEVPNPAAPPPVAPSPPTKVEDKPPIVVTKLLPRPPLPVAPFVVGGIGLVGFGVATAFGISAGSKNSASVAIQQGCTTAAACEEGKNLRAQAMSAATVANIGFGIGVIGAGTAIVLALLPNRSNSPESKATATQFIPWAGRDGGGAAVIGHF